MTIERIEQIIAQRNHCVEVIATLDGEIEQLQAINKELIQALVELIMAADAWVLSSSGDDAIDRARAVVEKAEAMNASST